MDSRPLLSVIVPTVGRASLARTVRSLLRQGEWLSWEAILVGDTHSGKWAQQLPFARHLAATDGHLSYHEYDGGLHAWGHPQRNYGATVARGHYLAWLGDDDIYLRGAFRTLAVALSPGDPRVHLFRWVAPWKQVLWHTAGFLAQDHIDAECVVCPNVPEKLGRWSDRYQGDYDFIAATVANWGGVEQVAWQPDVIALAQPSDAEDWTRRERAAPPIAPPVGVLQVLVPVTSGPEVPA